MREEIKANNSIHFHLFYPSEKLLLFCPRLHIFSHDYRDTPDAESKVKLLVASTLISSHLEGKVEFFEYGEKSLCYWLI